MKKKTVKYIEIAQGKRPPAYNESLKAYLGKLYPKAEILVTPGVPRAWAFREGRNLDSEASEKLQRHVDFFDSRFL